MYRGLSRKRVFDLMSCLISVFIFAPPFCLIALLIYLEERKSIFFTQERLGIGQKPFRVFKFRTMTEGRVTRVGSWLRKTGLDELPQYLNIVTGDMSIVGPRPLSQFDVDRLGWQEQKFRWRIKPGLTGLAQIRSGQGAEQSLRSDQEYLETMSFCLDCKIIGISFCMNLLGKRFVQRWIFPNRLSTL